MYTRKKKTPIHSLFIHSFFIVLSLAFIVPIWAVLAISVSNEGDLIQQGYSLIPKNLDFTAYQLIFKNPTRILSAYKVTTIISVVGLVLYLIMGTMIAYPLSRVDFKYRKGITFYLFFTMLFNGGMVPSYILMSLLGLRNTYAALILPLLGNVWYVFLMRSFFQQLPSSIIESATIDGASELQIYFQMILPLSKPVLATVGLLTLLGYWNSWFQALMYIDKRELYPLQYLLQSMLRNMQEMMQNMDQVPVSLAETGRMPAEATRMAMAIVATGPMLFIFPFFQKYFSKGLTVGSVKG